MNNFIPKNNFKPSLRCVYDVSMTTRTREEMSLTFKPVFH